MVDEKRRFAIIGAGTRADMVRLFWLLAFVAAVFALWLQRGELPLLLIAVTSLLVVGGWLLRRPVMKGWYVELHDDDFVIHILGDSCIAYSDLAEASHRGAQLRLRFQRAIPTYVLPFRTNRRSLSFKVDDPETLTRLLTARISA